MADEEIRFVFIADDTELRAALANLQSDFGGLEDAAEDAGDELSGTFKSGAGKATTAITALSSAGSKGGKSIGGLAIAIGLISPAASKGIRAMRGLRGATLATATAAAPLVLALGALAAGVRLYQSNQERLDSQRRLSITISSALESAENRLKAAYLNIAVAAGKVTTAELQTLRVRRQLFLESAPGIQAAGVALGKQRLRVDEARLALEQLDPRMHAFEQRNELLTLGLQKELAALENVTAERDRLVHLLDETVHTEIGAIEIAEEKRKSAEASAIALRDEADAERELAAAARKRAQEQARREREAETARRKREAQINESLDEVERRRQSKLQKQQEDEAKAAARSALIQQTVADSAGSITGSLADVTADAAERQAAAGKESSRVLFAVSKGAALAQIGFNAAVAITRQFADLPFPAALASSAAIAAGTIAPALATIASQSPPVEHLGTSSFREPLMPDEQITGGRRVQRQEISGPDGTVNSMGTSLINDLNNGRISGGGGAPTTAIIGRTHLDQELFRNTRRGTSRNSRQVRRNPHPKNNGGW